MESVKLATKPRPGHGSRAANKLRKDGPRPGRRLRPQAGRRRPRPRPQGARKPPCGTTPASSTSSCDGSAETAVIQEIQYDHLGIRTWCTSISSGSSRDERVKVDGPHRAEGHAGRPGRRPCARTAAALAPRRVPGAGHPGIDPRECHRPADSATRSTSRELTLPEGVKATGRSGPGGGADFDRQASRPPRSRRPRPKAAAATTAEPEIVGRRVAKEEEAEE